MGRLEATRKAAKIGRVMAVIFGIVAVLPPFQPILIAIAVFIYMAAGAEYRMVQMQEGAGPMRFGRWVQGPPPSSQYGNDVFVSPPPYGRKQGTEKEPEGLFEELYKKWGEG